MTTKTKSRPGQRIAVASAKELQGKALAALAGSSVKGKPQKAAIASAIESLRDSHESIFAVVEVAEWMAKVKGADSIGLFYVVRSLCSDTRDHYAEAMDAIAHLKHPATALLLKACEAMDAIQEVAEMAKDRDGNLSRKALSTLSRVTLSFLGESARWMEQAEEALGGDYGFGWLDELEYVAGLPEGEFRRLDEQQWWVAHHFKRLNDEQRQVVADFITTALKGQQ